MGEDEREAYRDRLVEEQAALAERLRRVDSPAELTSLADDLAATLRNVADNRTLWRDLEADSEVGLEGQQLSQLALVDWEQVLLIRGVRPEEALALAADLIVAARSATQGPAHWAEVREALVALADRLEEDAAEQRRKPGRLTVLRQRVASGIAALGHIKKATLAKGAADGLAEGLVPAAAAAVIAGVVFPPGFLVMGLAAGAVGLGRAAGEAVNRGLGEIKDEEVAEQFVRLEDELARVMWEVPTREDELAELGRLGREPGDKLGGRVVELISGLRSWLAAVGAKIAAEWPFVVAHVDQAGARKLESVTSAVVKVRQLLPRLWAAIDRGPRAAAEQAAEAAAGALGALEARLAELRQVAMVRALQRP
ncbi:MAG TPA: hypothetical protein VFS26_03405 [Solirubrobacterales bacterium]|nr:hypothetical protein [Solirubrobacterales bacterium]